MLSRKLGLQTGSRLTHQGQEIKKKRKKRQTEYGILGHEMLWRWLKITPVSHRKMCFLCFHSQNYILNTRGNLCILSFMYILTTTMVYVFGKNNWTLPVELKNTIWNQFLCIMCLLFMYFNCTFKSVCKKCCYLYYYIASIVSIVFFIIRYQEDKKYHQ